MHKIKLCFSLLAAFFFTALAAQPAYPAYSHYTTDDGLSHDEIISLAFDQEGFLWIGTMDGLNRFDGRTFRVYRHLEGHPTSLPGERINGITPGPDGRLWISTDQGLCWLRPAEGIFHRVPLPSLDSTHARNAATSALVTDRHGYGWISTNELVIRINLEDLSLQSYRHPEGYAGVDGHVFPDSQDRIWVHLGMNVFRLDPSTRKYKLYVGRDALDAGLRFPAGSIKEDTDGRVWVSTWGNGLYTYDPAKDVFMDYPDGTHITTDFEFDRDEFGRPFIWAGGSREGLYLWSLEEEKTVIQKHDPREPYSHNGGMITAIIRDPSTGIIWLGTDRGLEKYDPKNIRFQRILLPAQQDHSVFTHVADICRDRSAPADDAFFISVWGSSIYRWKRGDNSFTLVPWHEPGRPNGEPFDVEQDSAGRLWVAAVGGIYMYDPAKGQRRHFGDFLRKPNVNHKVICLGIEPGLRQVLAGCNNEGLVRVDVTTGAWQRIPLVSRNGKTLESAFITKLKRDSAGGWWVASFSGLFYLAPGATQARYVTDPGLPDNLRCDDIVLSYDGTLWVASTAGLFHLDAQGRKIAQFGPKQELHSRQLLRLAEDVNGHLWIGTGNGLFWHNPDAGIFYRFDKTDGLFFNSLGGAFTATEDGDLLIGFPEGFNFFNTKRPTINHRPPPVVLTGLRVLNQDRVLPAGATLLLRPGENMVSFDFAALNYSQSEKNAYAYRLEGFDKDWIYTNEGRATYTNLDGGHYTLRVKAANNDGYWNEQGLIVPLEVIPPFTKTVYFYLILAAGISLAVFGAFQLRKQQYAREQAIRDRIARDLHDDMGSTLSSIRFFSEFASSQVQNPQILPVLRQISDSAGKLSEAMQDIIWTINSDKDHLEDLMTRMREFGHRTLESRGIAFRVICDENFHNARLGLQQRRNLYLIFKEAVNNAAKYAECKEVTLCMQMSHNRLRMEVSDDGRGFNGTTNGSTGGSGGNGLTNMEKRARELGGRYRLDSQPGAGTTVSLQIPLHQAKISMN